MSPVVCSQLDRRRHGGMHDTGGLVGKSLELLPNAMDRAGPIVLDQQAQQVLRFGPELRLEKLSQLHPAPDTHRRVLKCGDQDVVLERLVKLGQLGPPGIDRVLLLGQLEYARGVAARYVARFRHESPPPRWCARSARGAFSHPGSRRRCGPRPSPPGPPPATVVPAPPSRALAGSRRGPSRSRPRPARAPLPRAPCAGPRLASRSGRAWPAPLTPLPRASLRVLSLL